MAMLLAGVRAEVATLSLKTTVIKDSEYILYIPLLQALLWQLLEAGDCQHVVMVCEVLRSAGGNIFQNVNNLPDMRRYEACVGYCED